MNYVRSGKRDYYKHVMAAKKIRREYGKRKK